MDSKLCSNYIEGRCICLVGDSAVYEKCIYNNLNVTQADVANCPLGKRIDSIASGLEVSVVGL